MNKNKGKTIIKYDDTRFKVKIKGAEPQLAIFVQILIGNLIEQGMTKKEFLEKMKKSYEIELEDRSDNNG